MHFKRFRRRNPAHSNTALYLAVAGALTTSPAAVSQEVAPNAGMEEVIVTATRREEAINDIGGSVIAVTPQDFTEVGLSTLSDIIDYTPGVSFLDRGAIGQGSIGMRGTPQTGNTPVVSIYVDDVPFSTNSPYASGAEYFYDGLLADVERVEVLKGPQGSLYGSVAVGGVIRYITREPALDEMRGSAGVTLSDTENGGLNQRYSARISTPIIKDTLGITVSGFYENREGYVDWIDPATGDELDSGINEADREGYALDLLYRFSDRGDVKLKVMHDENQYDSSAQIELAGAGSDDPLYGDFKTSSQPGDNDIQYDNYALTLSYEWDWATLTSVTSYVEYEITQATDLTNGLSFPVDSVLGREPGTTELVMLDFQSSSEKYVQEIRLTSPQSTSIEWLAGLYYADEDTEETQDILPTPPSPDVVTGAVDFPSTYTEYAAFGNVTYYVTPEFDLSVGARVSYHEAELKLTENGALLGLSDPMTTKFEDVDDTVGTYSFAARYRFNDNYMLYGRADSGYRPAGASIPIIDPFTGESINGRDLDSDSVWSFETGIKGSNADSTFSYDLAFWYSRWDDFQTTITAFGTSGNTNFDGKLESHGMDASIMLTPLAGLDISAGFSWNNNEVTSDDENLGAASGDSHPGVPESDAFARISYAFMLGGDIEARVGGGLRYVGEMDTAFSEDPNNINVKVDDYVLADLNFGLAMGAISGELFATNLFDEMELRNRSDAIVNPDPVVVSSEGVYTTPRTVGVSIRYDF